MADPGGASTEETLVDTLDAHRPSHTRCLFCSLLRLKAVAAEISKLVTPSYAAFHVNEGKSD